MIERTAKQNSNLQRESYQPDALLLGDIAVYSK